MALLNKDTIVPANKGRNHCDSRRSGSSTAIQGHSSCKSKAHGVGRFSIQQGVSVFDLPPGQFIGPNNSFSLLTCTSSTTKDYMGESSVAQTICNTNEVGPLDEEVESSDKAQLTLETEVLNFMNTFSIEPVFSASKGSSDKAPRTPKKKKTTLRVFLDHPNMIVSKRQSDGAARYDLHSAERVSVPPHSRELIDTGLKLMIPMGCYECITPRSGLAVKEIDIGAGVIDWDYVG